MRDWIVGYEKGATQNSPGVSEDEWSEAEGELGEAPEELRDFYRQMNGATFNSGVHVFPIRAKGPHRGLMEESRISAAGLPESGIWRFGEKGSKHLFSLRKTDAVRLDGAPEHDWLFQLDDSGWVYGVKDELTQVVKLYSSLENLLATLIPPAESDDFGERTYARAMTLVQSALDGLEEAEAASDEADETEEVEEAPPTKPSRPSRPAKKAKAAKGGKKAPARKQVAKRAVKKAAKKAAPAKKPAAKKGKGAAAKGGKKVAKPASKTARKAAPKPAGKRKKPAAKKGRR